MAGYELRDLDGTVQHFDPSGRWTQTVDKNGNAKVATYVGSNLTEVSFPDGRKETFTYHPSGKLATISEVGIDNITTRTWSYTWAGDDLDRIDRPDGTAWRFVYNGFLRMTRMILVGTDASERVEQAWSYDEFGNVIQTWKGANSFEDAAATEKWELSYDKPRRPEETMVTDPLGVVTTCQIDWPGSKPRITQVSGDCPTCGLGPNSQVFYFDGNNPQRPSREINGRGVITEMSYDLNGQLTSKIEAFGTALEREMTWDYDVTYPAFPTRVEQPSSTGNPLDLRVTTLSYDPSGNQDTRAVEGIEDENLVVGSWLHARSTLSPRGGGTPWRRRANRYRTSRGRGSRCRRACRLSTARS